MSLAQKYSKSLDEQCCLRFKTRHPDGDTYDGVVTHIKSGFIVLRQVMDFEFDGLMILPKRSITGYRDGKCESCQNRILIERGELQRVRPTRWLDSCTTLADVSRELIARKIWPAVETLFNDNTESDIFIGPITRLAEDGFRLRSYDAAGNWQKEYEITFDEIFSIRLDCNYVKRFNTHMRTRNPTSS